MDMTVKTRVDMLKADARKEAFCPKTVAHFIGFVGALEFCGKLDSAEADALFDWVMAGGKNG